MFKYQEDILSNEVKTVVEKYGNRRENLLRILQDLNDKYDYLSESIMQEVAKNLNISPSEVYGVATFYSFLKTKPKGKYVIRVCRTIVCDLHGKDKIINTIENELGIKVGETTKDGKFSLEYTNCMGMCNQGPAMLINNDIYYNLDPEKVVEIIEKYARGGDSNVD